MLRSCEPTMFWKRLSVTWSTCFHQVKIMHLHGVLQFSYHKLEKSKLCQGNQMSIRATKFTKIPTFLKPTTYSNCLVYKKVKFLNHLESYREFIIVQFADVSAKSLPDDLLCTWHTTLKFKAIPNGSQGRDDFHVLLQFLHLHRTWRKNVDIL